MKNLRSLLTECDQIAKWSNSIESAKQGIDSLMWFDTKQRGRMLLVTLNGKLVRKYQFINL